MIFALAGFLGGCASMRQPTGLDPANWLRHVAGADLRQDCGPESPDHYRLVMNGVSGRAARSVDIRLKPEGGALLEERELPLASPPLPDESDAGPGTRKLPLPAANSTSLSDWNTALLVHHLKRAGAFDGGVVGALAPTDTITWIMSGCRQGRWFSTAFADPGEGHADTVLPGWKG